MSDSSVVMNNKNMLISYTVNVPKVDFSSPVSITFHSLHPLMISSAQQQAHAAKIVMYM